MTGNTNRGTRTILLVAGIAVALFAPDLVHAAKSPFGVGLPDTNTSVPTGPLSSFFVYVAAKQSEFYQALTSAVKRLNDDGTAIWLLAGLSFGYGVFHAAGPGHGKAIISAYVVANDATARRGVALAFAAALVQAMSAIVIISVAAVLLGLTSMAITQTSRAIEIASYVLVVLLGLWLVYQKFARPFWRHYAGGTVAHAHDHHHHGHHHHDHDHGDHCGHSHAPDPSTLDQPLTLRGAWSAILAVGLRPCTGALVVLVFALSQGLYLAGILSTLVMAVGTGITVAAMAVIAVGAKDLALRLTGGSSVWGHRIHRLVEAGGAVFILLLGLVLLTAALGYRA